LEFSGFGVEGEALDKPPGDYFASTGATMTKTAKLYRMVLPDHVCPYGVRAKAMLEERGFALEDHLLESREAVDRFMADNGLATTPLIVIDGEQVGGSDDLERYLARNAENLGLS
jgi:glutaredoxin 3